jgi:hypothetical protein
MKRTKQILATVAIVMLPFSSLVHGDTWTAAKRLTITIADAAYPAIAVSGSNIYVVWEYSTAGTSEINFKRSVDGGVTWSGIRRLTKYTTNASVPDIAADDSNIYVVWSDGPPWYTDLFFRRSGDGGITWTETKQITKTTLHSESPALAVDGQNIYVVWYDATPGNNEIFFKRSVDGGATWQNDNRLTNTEDQSISPAITVDGPNIYVVWVETKIQGNDEIYFKRSNDGGVTWKPKVRLTYNRGVSWNPDIAVNGKNLYVVWRDSTAYQEQIYFKRSNDGGTTWQDEKRLTNREVISVHPKIAVDGANIYVVWYTHHTMGNCEIYFRRSVDGGNTWRATKRLSNNPGRSDLPAIAVDGPNISVVWSDDTPKMRSHPEIYFKKGVMD